VEDMFFAPWKNEESDIQIRYSSIDTENRLVRYSLHWHAYFELEFFMEGTVSNVINGQEYIMHAGSLSLLSPNDFHKLTQKEVPLRIRKLTFLSSALSTQAIHALEEFGYPFMAQLDESASFQLNLLFGELEAAYRCPDIHTGRGLLRIRLCAERILLFIFEHASPSEKISSSIPPSSPVLTAIRYINDHLAEPLSVSALADMVYLSADHFAHLFKKCTSVTITEYIIEQRMMRSYYMLIDTDTSCTDIARAVGYRSAALFYRHFQRRFGFTPGDMRKLSNEKIPMSEMKPV